jgi:Membrane carboxypeptidase (penicillin-binding protein)
MRSQRYTIGFIKPNICLKQWNDGKNHGAMINLGVYNQPHTIRSIEFTDGSTYTPTENQNKRVLSSGSAYLMDVLMNRNTDGTVFNYMIQLDLNSVKPSSNVPSTPPKLQ